LWKWFKKVKGGSLFKDLVKIMVDADLEAAGLSSPGEGKKIICDKGLAWNEHR
jgi:GDPmannose 4,6-dehydratase